MSAFTKFVAGISNLGAFGGVIALGAYSLINIQKIDGRLKSEGYEPLNTEINEGWESVLASYKKAKSNTFENGENLESESVSGLKNKCKLALNKKSDSNKDYFLARQWCVKERGVSDILVSLTLRALKTEPLASVGSETNEDDKNWDEKVTNYKKDDAKYKEIIGSEEQGNTEKAKLQAACKKLISELKTTADGFNDKLEQVKEWCAIKNNAK